MAIAQISIAYIDGARRSRDVRGAYIATAISGSLTDMLLRAIKRPTPVKRPRYHHGNLKEALVDATVKLIEERGVENVSVREAAKRVGVSSGAPFRHFPTRTALLTAVAEQATRLLLAAMTDALARRRSAGPLERFRALGTAYMRWVIAHPTQFAIVSNRKLIDYEASASLGPDNEKIRALMDAVLNEAREGGLLRASNIGEIALAARATAYGLARMYTDGHFSQWAKGSNPRQVFDAVLDLFIRGIAINS